MSRKRNPNVIFKKVGKKLIEISTGREINLNSEGLPIATYDRDRYLRQIKEITTRLSATEISIS
jgi:biotin synthase-related radical SAM superfamily protein